MTDEDERMDRARRIREMREGNRPDEEQSADHDGDGGDGGEADESGGVDESSSDDESRDEAETGGDSGETDERDDTFDSDDTDERVEADAAASSETGDPEDDGGGSIQIPGAEVGDVSIDPEELARQAGLDTVDTGDENEANVAAEAADADGTGIEAAPADGDSDAAAGSDAGEGSPIGMAGSQTAGEQSAATAETRVLEFNLGPERYCLDIDYVEEIVKRETVTRVPNTPDYVEGVVDLRGQITTILDPKVLLDIDAEGSKDLIVVFDPDDFEEQGAIGWVVDDVNRVTPIADDEVNDSPVDQEHINGVVDRDDEFVIWTTPKVDVEDAAG